MFSKASLLYTFVLQYNYVIGICLYTMCILYLSTRNNKYFLNLSNNFKFFIQKLRIYLFTALCYICSKLGSQVDAIGTYKIELNQEASLFRNSNHRRNKKKRHE